MLEVITKMYNIVVILPFFERLSFWQDVISEIPPQVINEFVMIIYKK
jgi:hypothetical protein